MAVVFGTGWLKLQPPTRNPLPCVVLGVDPAALSGWFVTHRDQLLQYGTVDRQQETPDAAVRVALAYAKALCVPLVMMGEKTGIPGKRRSGIDGAWSAWQFALKRNYAEFIQRPKNPITDTVYLSTWRKRVLGHGNMSKDVSKWMATETINRRYGLDLSHERDHDIAEAGCVAVYATYSRELCDKLPRRALKGWSAG